MNVGTWVKVRPVAHIHGEIVGVIVGIPAHAAETMVTVRYSTLDYRGWPVTENKWVMRSDVVATGPAAFEA